MSDEMDRRIVEATMARAVLTGWARLSMHEVAVQAGLNPVELYRRAGSKFAVLGLLSDVVNEGMLNAVKTEAVPEERARDRLFEVILARLDALRPYREGLKAIVADLPCEPLSGLVIAALLPRAMGWMLEAAGLPFGGLSGSLHIAAVSGLYMRVLKTWLDDDSEGDARTMAVLDRNLKQAESLANRFGFMV